MLILFCIFGNYVVNIEFDSFKIPFVLFVNIFSGICYFAIKNVIIKYEVDVFCFTQRDWWWWPNTVNRV